jgi:hypothetical protein
MPTLRMPRVVAGVDTDAPLLRMTFSADATRLIALCGNRSTQRGRFIVADMSCSQTSLNDDFYVCSKPPRAFVQEATNIDVITR